MLLAKVGDVDVDVTVEEGLDLVSRGWAPVPMLFFSV